MEKTKIKTGRQAKKIQKQAAQSDPMVRRPPTRRVKQAEVRKTAIFRDTGQSAVDNQ